MINKNIFDTVMDAVEEYNEYTRKKDVSKLSYEEKRGLFYNCLRRWLILRSKNYPALRVENLMCIFSPSGTLESYSILGTYWKGYASWDDKPVSNTIEEIKKIGAALPKIYPTKVLNQMALIVNSIKS